jgi:hypothetical protein
LSEYTQGFLILFLDGNPVVIRIMLDWLALWGVTQAVGFVFKPVLEDLAKSTAKGWVSDYFKKSFQCNLF